MYWFMIYDLKILLSDPFFNKYNVLTKENNGLKNYSWTEKKIIRDGNGVKPSLGSLQCAHINIIIIIIFLNKGPLKISECRYTVHGVYTHSNIIGMRFRFIFTPYRKPPRRKCSEMSILYKVVRFWGAQKSTPWLYRVFPEHFILFKRMTNSQ